jgi:hypothetical protein
MNRIGSGANVILTQPRTMRKLTACYVWNPRSYRLVRVSDRLSDSIRGAASSIGQSMHLICGPYAGSLRLLISRFQIRVLGGSLLKFLQTAVKLESLDVLLFVGDPAPQDFAQLVKPYRL